MESKRKRLEKQDVRNNEKEIVELNKILRILMKLLRESLNCGWKIRKRVKFPIVHIYPRKVIQIVKLWFKIEANFIEMHMDNDP